MAFPALVADYSSSSSSSIPSDSEDSQTEVCKSSYATCASQGLPSAKAMLSTGAGSKAGNVFQNQFTEKMNAEKTLLEKHVKMVDSSVHAEMRNGRKICWNYRKGRCRFGSKCQYAHDSDLIAEADDSTKEKNVLQAKRSLEMATNHKMDDEQSSINLRNDGDNDAAPAKKLKRPGLSDALVPGKRVIKNYNKLKSNSN